MLGKATTEAAMSSSVSVRTVRPGETDSPAVRSPVRHFHGCQRKRQFQVAHSPRKPPARGVVLDEVRGGMRVAEGIRPYT